ncbi:KRAB-A domain-containing protein 2-like [Pectinophora gossypiella]|uniref:KRAB-A domain-containing protein 2-like n=1 Tax=Pectinophora gossypiella TaxID=13191 RepID=UPI00214EBC1B|nr:KRAB-A domain-containing protein 2-like [Pectinophora gossypiella]
MSDIQPVHQQSSEIPAIVNQDEFTIELQNYYSGHNENSKKLQWTNQRIQSVIKLLDEYNTIKSQGKRPTTKHYHHARKYDVMNIGNQKVLIMKRKDISDPVVQIIPTDEYYQKILDAHIATGHGRRDKIVHTLKDKYVVPIFAVSIFLNLCKTCLAKKSFPKKGIVVKPLISDDFNRRGQIDLVDFQTSPDQEYEWLLQYQDHLTKFCFLRPLKSKQAKEVAIEILKIFLEVGCPHILQSDNGREFTASVLKEIVSLWPACKIINGRPRYPQSQGSIERSNQDIKNMIRAWMTDNKSTNWSIGCYFVQFQKNSSYHSTIARSPYKALFGEDPKLGLSSTYLSKNIISKLENEEDLQKLFEEINNNKEQNSENDQEDNKEQNSEKHQEDNTEQNSEKDQEEEEQENVNTINISKIDTLNIKQEEITAASHEIIMLEQINTENNPKLHSALHENLPVVTEVIIHKPDNMQEKTSLKSTNSINSENQGKVDENIYKVSEAYTCTKCKKIVQAICGVVSEENEGYGSQLLCTLCVNERNIVQERTQSHKNLKRAADKMLSTSSKKFKDMSTGSTVLVEVPKVDIGPLDSKNLIGKVLMKKNELYQVGTASGIIKDWMSRNALLSCPNAELLIDIPEVTLPLRTVASMSSSFGGQGMKQCNCKKNKNGQCVSNKCNCKKANVLCNSRCHSSLTCNNK